MAQLIYTDPIKLNLEKILQNTQFSSAKEYFEYHVKKDFLFLKNNPNQQKIKDRFKP